MADTETPGSEATTEQTSAETTETPWGDDFDAARAWKLVQNLRSERDTIKAERDSLKSERQGRDDELSKLQEKLANAEKDASDVKRDLTLQKVLRKFPDLEDFVDLLTGENEEEITAKAERLAAIGSKKDPAGDPGTDGEKAPETPETPELPEKPKPNLVPGHGGDDAAPFDPVAIAKAARR